MCQVLTALIEAKQVERINIRGRGISKKFARYQLTPYAPGGGNFTAWPFVPAWHDMNWLERRARSRKAHKR